MINYFWWIPGLFIWCVFFSWASIKVNQNPTSLLFYFLFFPIPIWAFVTRVSNNLLFDGLLYDVLICLFYAGCFIAMGEGKHLTPVNYIGIVTIITGLILTKI